ncbi:MAG: T9SS type A sorting domain-containing protein [Bacteroidetes bacterium]|nr:T9SS type A sorting domain-containing protein [Bacteroidota bacterium]
MFKKLFLLPLLLLNSLIVKSQSNSIKLDEFTKNSFCENQDVVLTFSSNVKFGNSNIFKVFISNQLDNNFLEIESKLTEKTLIIKIPKINNLPFKSTPFDYLIKIKSSEPEITSNVIPITITTLPNVILSGQALVNPYTKVAVTLSGQGSWPSNIVLDDNSSFSFDNYFNPSILLQSGISKEYKIMSVNNKCGEGEFKGSFNLKINPIALKIISLGLDYSYCKGSDFYVTVAKTGLFNQNNNFQVQVRENSSSKFINLPTIAVSDTILKVTIPKDISINSISTFRVTATSPEVNGEVLEKRITLADKSISLSATPFINQFSKNLNLGVKFKGIGPFEAKFRNGLVISSNNTSEGEIWASKIIPFTDDLESYEIESAQSSCGDLPIPEGGLSIKIPNEKKLFIDIDALEHPPGICINTGKFEIPIVSNIPTLNNSLGIKFSLLYLNFYGEVYKTREFDATLTENNKTLLVNIPSEALANVKETGLRFKILVTNPNIESPIKEIRFFDIPSLVNIAATNSILDKPENVLIRLDYTNSKARTTVMLNDNSEKSFGGLSNAPIEFSVFPNETTTYKVKKISNVCGTIDNPKPIYTSSNYRDSLKITVSRPLEYKVKIKIPEKAGFCLGENFKINLEGVGNPPKDQVYKVEIYNSSSKNIIGQGTLGAIDANIPNDPKLLGNSPETAFNQAIRILGPDGSIVSNDIELKVFSKPKAYIADYDYSYNKKLILNEPFSYSVYITGGGSLIKYQFDELPEVEFNINYNYKYSSVNYLNPFIPKRVGYFNLKSIQNECGIGEVTSEGLKVIPYNLTLLNNPNIPFCEGLNTIIPINYVSQGDITKAEFKVEVSLYGQNNFKEIKIVKPGNPMWVQVPEGFFQSSSLIDIRVIDKTIYFKSNTIQSTFYTSPKITLTSQNGNTGEIVLSDSDESSSCINIKSTMQHFHTVWIEGIGEVTANNCVRVSPKVSTIYKVAKVSTACGYFNSNSQILVRIPKSAKITTNTTSYCIGGKMSVDYKIKGDFSLNTIFEFFIENFNNNNDTYVLGKNEKIEDSNYNLNIPSTLKPGTYKLAIKSDGIVLGNTVLIQILDRPSASISGNATINNGKSTYLTIVSDTENSFFNYSLSEGLLGQTVSKTTFVKVSPKQTTTYKLISVTNLCGKGQASGEAMVIVNSKTEKEINEVNLNKQKTCPGEKINVTFASSGLDINSLQLEISDKNGLNFNKMPFSIFGNSFVFTVPENLPTGTDYRIKILSDDPSVSGSTSILPFEVIQGISVSVSSSKPYFTTESPATVNFEFNGTPPFYLIYDDSSAIYKSNYYIQNNQYRLSIRKPGNYKVFQLSNNLCSMGLVKGLNPLTIGILTATENPYEIETLIYPNPAVDYFEFSEFLNPVVVKILSPQGRILKIFNSFSEKSPKLNISDLPSGKYIVEILTKEKSLKKSSIIKL